jgi:hypothetical protein
MQNFKNDQYILKQKLEEKIQNYRHRNRETDLKLNKIFFEPLILQFIARVEIPGLSIGAKCQF